MHYTECSTEVFPSSIDSIGIVIFCGISITSFGITKKMVLQLCYMQGDAPSILTLFISLIMQLLKI